MSVTSLPHDTDRPLVVAIAGGSGSGKSTLVDAIQACSPRPVSVLRHDAYYRDQSDLPRPERDATNFDDLDAIETELFVQHLDELIAGNPIVAPEYDFSTHTRTSGGQRVQPADLILAEGVMVLAEPAIRQRVDLAVYVELDPDIRFIRRLQRDMAQRDRRLGSIVDQYVNTVRPFQLAVVEASRQHADLVVSTQNFERLTRVISRILT